jgi:threonylcarbamoyladenosine tRNA methylthiotransferase MtaB
MPHASIGTDVIVGFPGEDAGHFEQLRDAVAQLPFAYVHVFPYSDRPGTEASSRGSKLGGVEIRERGATIRGIAAQKAAAFRAAHAGTMRRALTVNDGRSAVTDNYLKVQLPAQHPRNQWVTVTIS